MAAIVVRNLSVDIPIYDIGASSLKKLMLGRTVGGRFAQSRSHIIVNALKDVSFDAVEGDRIALIGNNGSGKSSLLRVLSGVYPPTRGTVHVDGRVSPMFDATLGMTMDATGLENIRMSGLIRGLTRAQIEDNIEDITDFTDLGDYLNVPVRTYSSGMMLRLAFAIATVGDPEILLIDEAIGVGDAQFFDKAFKRLQGVVERSRLMFVASHAPDVLRRLCTKAIWMSHGSLMAFGELEEVLEAYKVALAGPPPALPPQPQPVEKLPAPQAVPAEAPGA